MQPERWPGGAADKDFFISLEDNNKFLLDTHVDAYLNLLNKMRGSKTSPYKFKDRMGIVDCNFFVSTALT